MVAETFILWSIVTKERERGYHPPTGLSPERNVEREIYLPTKYSSENRSEANAAWKAIRTGHGVVAIDKQWAADRNLVNSVTWPDHPEQSLYVIEAYHVLHCAKNIRNHFLALLDGKERYWEVEHDFHCFDTIRQHIMCNADDTLLRTTGHQDAGRGQIVSCKNWDALSQWAGERTSCYDDHEPTVDDPRFGACGRGDGLPVGSVLG
ncbi:hypothetical protein EAF04_002602 [Stromatinia cepivora]|nr:hypothetical protein EAF04_002602 [Stromatinia cepivora]